MAQEVALKTFEVELLTPERMVLKQTARSVVLPGSQGELGVLAGHASLLTALTRGRLKISDSQGKAQIFSVTGGFAEVQGKRVIILADAAERADLIDVERAQRAKQRALERLAQKKEDIDLARARAALARAENRLKVSGKEE